MNTSRGIRLLLLFAVAVALSACGSLVGPRVMTFSEADMARLLEEHGPFQGRLLEVLEVRVNRPTVRLLPQSDRLSSDLRVSTTERLSGKTYNGRIAVDYGLRYDDAAKAIKMTQVRVNNLQIDGLPSPQRAGLNRLGALIAEQLLDGAVLYRFKASDLDNARGLGFKPGAIAVTSRGVEVTLAPAR